MGNWITNRAPALLQPAGPLQVQPYREAPKDQRVVYVRSTQRAFLLRAERVEVGERVPVPKWLADDLTAARPDIRIVD